MKGRREQRCRLLLVGPLPIAGDVIGGTKVSFAGMVDGLREDPRFEVSVHSTSRALAGCSRLGRTWRNLAGLAAVLCSILDPRRRHDAIVFSASSGGALRSGPLIRLAAGLRRTPLVLRLFGGDFDLHHDRAGWISRGLARSTFLTAPLLLFQTKMLCERFGSARRWWPTTRDLRPDPAPRRSSATRFLFLSQLRREKGIGEALEAIEELPEGATLTVCGPPMPGYELAEGDTSGRVDFRGALPHEEVRAVLAEHDVLLFPSYHGGEGMPGILIEALQMGLPVICSDWRALPEIIQHEENGLLVAPRSAPELAAAMRRILDDGELFQQLGDGALRSGERYRRPEWNRVLGDWLFEVAATNRPAAASSGSGSTERRVA